VYDAAGQKLSVTYQTAVAGVVIPMTNVMKPLTNAQISQTFKTDYCGNVIYENGAVSRILTEEGYITFNGTTPVYHYYLKDHQGNNRVVLNQNGTVEQVNHYYLFGGLMGESTAGGVQPYKYNGKELDRMHGLDLFDYGARHYDATIGRWSTIDPMSEEYYSISPYAYCGNNPIRFIDPTGMSYDEPEKEKKPSFFNQLYQAFNTLVGVFAHDMGIHPKQLQSENPAVREDASVKREKTINTLNAVNETLLSPIPGGEIGYKLATDQKISKETVVWEAVGVIPAVKGGKIAAKSGVQYTKSSLKLGQEMHKAYKAGLDDGINTIKEFRLPSGKRIDFLDIPNRTIYELKPYNPRAMKAGQKQLDMYMKELQTIPEYKGFNWKTVLDTY
jgi:RHS repeat-associated protein